MYVISNKIIKKYLVILQIQHVLSMLIIFSMEQK